MDSSGKVVGESRDSVMAAQEYISMEAENAVLTANTVLNSRLQKEIKGQIEANFWKKADEFRRISSLVDRAVHAANVAVGRRNELPEWNAFTDAIEEESTAACKDLFGAELRDLGRQESLIQCLFRGSLAHERLLKEVETKKDEVSRLREDISCQEARTESRRRELDKAKEESARQISSLKLNFYKRNLDIGRAYSSCLAKLGSPSVDDTATGASSKPTGATKALTDSEAVAASTDAAIGQSALPPRFSFSRLFCPDSGGQFKVPIATLQEPSVFPTSKLETTTPVTSVATIPTVSVVASRSPSISLSNQRAGKGDIFVVSDSFFSIASPRNNRKFGL